MILQAAAAARITGDHDIITAAQDGDIERVRDLLIADLAFVHQTEKPPAQMNRTALHIFSETGHLEACKLLIECRADVNAGDG